MPSNKKKTSITAPNKAACIHRHIHKHVYMSICTMQPRYKERVLFTQTFPSFDVQYEYANQQAYFGNLSHSFSAYQRPVYMSSSSLLACSLISVTIWAGIRTSRLALGKRPSFENERCASANDANLKQHDIAKSLLDNEIAPVGAFAEPGMMEHACSTLLETHSNILLYISLA